MKTKILLFAMAAFCLASCDKENLEKPSPVEGDGEYLLEILDSGSGTKSTPATVSLNLANLTNTSSKTITAQLKKKSGSSWTNITSGVTYSWSASTADNKKFSGSGTVNQSCTVSAKAAGDGEITVSANYGGSTVASQDVPVSVSDSRALSWSNATTSLTAGEVKSAVLNSNFSCTATITSDNSSFLIGTTQSNLSSSASVTFESNKTQTIYYKYTGSSQTTVKIEAISADDVIGATLGVSVISAGPATLTNLYAYPEKTNCYINDVVPVKYVAKYSDGSTKDISYSELSDFSFWFAAGEAPTEDWQAEVHDCYLYSTGFVAKDGEAGSLLNLAGKLTGSSYCIECDVSYTENGKTVTADFYIEVNVEIVGVEVAASGNTLYKSKPNQIITFWPKFKLRTGDGSKAYFGLSSEAKDLVEIYGDYGYTMRGSEIMTWELTVDDCLSGDLYYKTEIDLFVRYPGLSITSTNVTYDPNN